MSKIISGSPNFQAVMRSRQGMSAFASRVGGAYLRRTGVPYLVPEDAVFYAPLRDNVNDFYGLAPTFTRASDGLYEKSPNNWQVAPANAPRFESGYLLMEPASTNVCNNYNFEVDAALTGIALAGGGTTERVFDGPAIERAGFGSISNGYCVRMMSDGTDYFNTISGAIGTTNVAAYSCWAKKIGTTGQAFVRTNTGQLQVEITNTEWQRVECLVAATTSSQFQIRCQNGAEVWWFGNQLEDLPEPSSPIITSGAAGNRAGDSLSYANSDSIFNQSEGMVSIDWVPKHIRANAAGSTLLATISDVSGLLYFNSTNNTFTTFDGVAGSNVSVGDFGRGELFRVVAMYGPPGTGPDRFSVGYKRESLQDYSWDTNNNRTYTGPWPSVNILRTGYLINRPMLIRNFVLWAVNKGQSWIESNWTP